MKDAKNASVKTGSGRVYAINTRDQASLQQAGRAIDADDRSAATADRQQK